MALDVITFYKGISEELGPEYTSKSEQGLTEYATMVSEDGSPVIARRYTQGLGFTYGLQAMPLNATTLRHSVGLVQAEHERRAQFMETDSSPFDGFATEETYVEYSSSLRQPALAELVRSYVLGSVALTAKDSRIYRLPLKIGAPHADVKLVRALGRNLRNKINGQFVIDDAFLDRCASR